MTSLEPPDLMHLHAAEGWLGLGNWQEANDEWEKIAPALRSHPDVLEVQYEICAKARRWEQCVGIAKAMVKLAPQGPFGWIRRSFALHELKSTKMALEKLLPAAERFPKDITIRYNLACYECVLGNMGKAKLWLAEALGVAQNQKSVEQWRMAASEDPDLEPLWDYLAEARI